jgi:hypothetical protein
MALRDVMIGQESEEEISPAPDSGAKGDRQLANHRQSGFQHQEMTTIPNLGVRISRLRKNFSHRPVALLPVVTMHSNASYREIVFISFYLATWLSY